MAKRKKKIEAYENNGRGYEYRICVDNEPVTEWTWIDESDDVETCADRDCAHDWVADHYFGARAGFEVRQRS